MRRTIAGWLLCSALAGGALFFPDAANAGALDAARGRILIRVEAAGEAWYVDPVREERVQLGRPANAWRVMREYGLGVTDADLSRIPAAAKVDGDVAPTRSDATLVTKLAGRILLRVQANGEAWYVDPVDRKRHYLGKPDDAFAVMRARGLGITDDDIRRIPEAGVSLRSVRNDVPFVAQAPRGVWGDVRQQEGCEEASVMMAVAWAEGRALDSVAAEQEIVRIADFEKEKWGYHEDTGVRDTAERILKGWYKHERFEIKERAGIDDVYRALADGHLAVVPVDGVVLANPWFSRPFPPRHMVTVVGYDADAREFLVHEVGTRKGAYWRYSRETLAEALRDYPSGVYEPVKGRESRIIVVKK